MIKLKSLLTENRLRDLEKSEVARVNKEFERLVKGISKSRQTEKPMRKTTVKEAKTINNKQYWG